MSNQPQALVVCSEAEDRQLLAHLLTYCGVQPVISSTFVEAQEILARGIVGMVFCEISLVAGGCHEILREAERAVPKVFVVVVCRAGNCQQYLEAMEWGAFDYMARPYRRTEVEWIVHKALSARSLTNQDGEPLEN